MKKIISWIMLFAMILGMFAGCGKAADPTQPATTAPVEIPEVTVATENNALDVTNYLQAIYKDSGAKTSGDFQRFGIVRIAGVPYTVEWTVDVPADKVTVVVNDDGTVTIDVNEKCTEDTKYTLTATVTDSNGNTETASWEYLLPGVASLEEMHAIIDQAYSLEVGQALPEATTLYGVITSIDSPYSDQYQNITVTIQVEGREDKPIICYRLKGEGAADLNPGDTISVQGIIKNYNNKIEFDAGCTLNFVEKTGKAVEIPSDPHQILNDVYALGDNETLPYGPVTLTGRICSIDTPYSEQYKNITVSIIIDWYTIKCYRLKGEGADTLEMNDIITVKGYIKKYNGTREFDVPELLNVVKVGEYAQPTDQLHVAKVAYNLDPGWTVPYGDVTLTGTITKVNSAWSDKYKNVTVTITVDGDTKGEYPIECYRMTVGEKASKELQAAVKNLQKGDKITVKGILMKYQNTKNGSTKVEFNVPELIKYTPAPNPDKGPFNKISTAAELVSGKYVMVVETGYAPANLDGTWISTTKPVIEKNQVTDSKGAVWTLSVYGNQVKITDSTGASIAPVGGNANGISSGNYKWNWTRNADGTFTFSGVGDDTVKLASNNSEDAQYGGFHRFRAYKNTTVTNNKYPVNFTLYLMPGSEFEPAPEGGSGSGSATGATLLTKKPVDGDVIAIVNSGKAMTATASGSKLASETATVSGDKLTVTEKTAQLKVSVDANGYYTFTTPDGKYLTSGATGNSLTLAASASNYSLWIVESAGSNQWYIKSVNAKYSGKVQSLEYYNSNFTTYGHGTTAAYRMDLYLVATAPSGAPLMTAAPTDGSTVAIVNGKYAMTSTASGKKLAAETAEIADGYLTVSDKTAQLQVSIDANGYYTFTTPDGKYLTSGATGNELKLAASASNYSLWNVESAGNNKWYIKNVNAKYNGNVQSIEYYSGFTTYGHKTTDIYKMELYLISEGSGSVTPPVDPKPDTPPATDGVLELTVDSLKLASDTYYTGKATVGGIGLDLTQIGNYGTGIQMRDKNGNTSILFNTDALPGKITKIELKSNATKTVYNNPNAVIFSFGAAKDNLTYSTKLSTVADQTSYTITPVGDFSFFKIEHDLGYTLYWDSIKIFYETGSVTPDPKPEPPATNGALTLTVDSLKLASDTYYTGKATVGGIGLDLTQIGNYGTGIQMRDKNGNTSILFNTDALPGKITKIELKSNATKTVYNNPNAVIFSFGAAKDNLTYSTKLSTVADQTSYTIVPEGDFSFFKIEHDLGYTLYWDSITIHYEEASSEPPVAPPVATTATITFDDVAKRTVFTTSQQVWAENGVTVTNDKSESTNNIGDYKKPARFYKGSKLTIAYPGMTKIEVSCNTAPYANELKNSISGATVTVSGNIVTIELPAAADTFVVAKMNAQVRVDSLTVYAGGSQGGTTPDPEPEEPELTMSDISAALAATTGEFMVKGVVTMKEANSTSTNLYIQDATGGICVRVTGTADAKVGDTVIATGTRGAYGGLPQLTGSYEKSSGMTLSTKKMILDDLADEHLCTSISVDGLTVTAVNGTNITVQDDVESIIVLYKPVTSAELKVGDKFNFTGSLGVYNGTYQLRNSDASEIVIVPDEPVTPPPAEPVVSHVDFNTITTTQASGGDAGYTKSYTTASGWTTVNSAIQVGGPDVANPAYPVVGADNSFKAVCINGKTTAYGYIVSPTLTGGISKLSIKYTKMFTDTKLGATITITDKATGTTYTKTISRDVAKDADKYVVWTFDWVLDTPITGDFTIAIVNTCPSGSTSNKDRMTILDIAWTSAV